MWTRAVNAASLSSEGAGSGFFALRRVGGPSRASTTRERAGAFAGAYSPSMEALWVTLGPRSDPLVKAAAPR
jgi:hypothetical protein